MAFSKWECCTLSLTSQTLPGTFCVLPRCPSVVQKWHMLSERSKTLQLWRNHFPLCLPARETWVVSLGHIFCRRRASKLVSVRVAWFVVTWQRSHVENGISWQYRSHLYGFGSRFGKLLDTLHFSNKCHTRGFTRDHKSSASETCL